MSQGWMPLYVADYLADTGHLTAQEHGAYLLLIMHYWCNGSLPADERKLARIARHSDSEWTQTRDTIADFFDANWQHFRIDAELATARERHEARAIAGSKGGRARFKPSSSNAQAGLNQSQSHSSELRSSDAEASPQARMWTEGKPALMALGVSEKQSGPMIGRWLKDTGDNHALVLLTIFRARDSCPHNPIPWITQSLKPQGKPNGKAPSAIMAAADNVIDYFERRDSQTSKDAVGLLPDGRGK